MDGNTGAETEATRRRKMREDRPKKTSRAIVIAASALILLGAGTLAFFKMPAFHNLLHPHPGDNTAKVAQGPTKYTCPMHPFIVSDKPGACPDRKSTRLNSSHGHLSY